MDSGVGDGVFAVVVVVGDGAVSAFESGIWREIAESAGNLKN